MQSEPKSDELSRLAREIATITGGNSPPTTKEERQEVRLERFEQKVNGLWTSQPITARYPDYETQAYEAIGDAIDLLKLDPPPRELLATLVQWLERLTPAECLRLISPAGQGRPPRIHRAVRAVEAFLFALNHEMSQHQAEIAAYDAYFGEGAYAKDLLVTKGMDKSVNDTTQAEYAMRKTIRPILRGAGIDLKPVRQSRRSKK